MSEGNEKFCFIFENNSQEREIVGQGKDIIPPSRPLRYKIIFDQVNQKLPFLSIVASSGILYFWESFYELCIVWWGIT